MKDGVLYYSTQYEHASNSKQDNGYCLYKTNGSCNFGHIQLFVLTPSTYAIVKRIEPLDQSIMNQAVHPCRSSLIMYNEADLLNHYVVPIQPMTTDICTISLQQIISRVVIVTVSGNQYCILQPNTIEYY